MRDEDCVSKWALHFLFLVPCLNFKKTKINRLKDKWICFPVSTLLAGFKSPNFMNKQFKHSGLEQDPLLFEWLVRYLNMTCNCFDWLARYLKKQMWMSKEGRCWIQLQKELLNLNLQKTLKPITHWIQPQPMGFSLCNTISWPFCPSFIKY